MLVLRPIREDELSALVALARATRSEMTTLPPDEEFLRERIDESRRAFRPGVKKPGAEFYLFVLEDGASGALAGTSGIAARVGGFDPFYSYEIRTEHFAHAPLGISKDVSVLHLAKIHAGPTELCSLFLRPEFRRAGAGRLLSLGRFLFIAAFRPRFDSTVIAELRGHIDREGRSPFWESVGRHFFNHDFYAADRLSGLGNKEFIADLMPRHPIYLPLLPPAVQATIGRAHHEAEPALALLRAEGLAPTNEVDIFDAGPLVRAPMAGVRTVRQARTGRLAAMVPEAVLERTESGESPSAELSSAESSPAEPPAGPLRGASLRSQRYREAGSPLYLVSNTALEFRATVGKVEERQDGIALGREVAKALRVKVGDPVLYAPLFPGP